jgi:signal peptidase II
LASPDLTQAQAKVFDRRVLFWVALILMLVVDQLVKAWARQTFAVNTNALGGAPFPGIFELTLTYNEGIAFGLFQGRGVLLTPVAILMAAAAGVYSWRHPKEHAVTQVAMGLLASGALGNLIDRLFLKHVTDLFYFRLINFPVFNVADACITVSAILLIGTWLFDALRTQATKKPDDARAS